MLSLKFSPFLLVSLLFFLVRAPRLADPPSSLCPVSGSDRLSIGHPNPPTRCGRTAFLCRYDKFPAPGFHYADDQSVQTDNASPPLSSSKPTQPPDQTPLVTALAETPIHQSEAALRFDTFSQILETPPLLGLSHGSTGLTQAQPLLVPRDIPRDVPGSVESTHVAPPRRARPASYHGRPSSQQSSGRTHSGGIRPLQLAIKVASATNSPRLLSDMAFPDVGLNTPQSVPATKTHFQIDDDIYNDIRTHSSSPPHSADKPVLTATAFAEASSRHRRLLSGQAFVQHEREALLARIAELEKVLQEERDRHKAELSPPHNIGDPSDVELHDEMSAGWATPVVEDDSCRSGYLSPPVSPPEASRSPLVGGPVLKEIEDAHDLTVLDHGSPTKPRLQVTSSTLLFARKGEASSSLTGSQGIYFDGDSGVASPTNA